MASTQPRGLPGGATWAGEYQSPEAIAKKMFAERDLINAKTKLTWNPDGPARYSTDRMVGEVNLSAPYIRIGTTSPGRYYYIQNAGIFLTNGKRTSMKEIEALEDHDPVLLANIKKSLEVFLNEAAKRDDALCKICVSYRAKDHEDYLKHILEMHPDHAAVVAGISSVQEPSSSKVGAPEPSPAVPTTFSCGNAGCGTKTFPSETALGTHKRFSKLHRGA